MTSSGMVMVALEDSAAKVTIRGNVDTAFVSEDAVDMLPIGEPRAKGRGNGAIHGLEGLEDEGVGGGGRGNAKGESRIDDVDKERGR